MIKRTTNKSMIIVFHCTRCRSVHVCSTVITSGLESLDIYSYPKTTTNAVDVELSVTQLDPLALRKDKCGSGRGAAHWRPTDAEATHARWRSDTAAEDYRGGTGPGTRPAGPRLRRVTRNVFATRTGI
ncbi:hypothetical protein EVAR_8948_1 [Eumeta japonica]|uniref:Uncharacterized protein n=1 Tax=Eumeta variegata TaxID=151549 RepID=A0A4C1U0R1_EUMVA|nr:hypothetical protein EVAR_8948_1 [Eumeta japonica]